MIAIQAEYAPQPEMIPQATALVAFGQLIGGTLGISIGGTIFANQLNSSLSPYRDALGPELIQAVRQSVTVVFNLPAELRKPVVDAYVHSVATMFIVIVPVLTLAGLFGTIIKDWNLKKRGGTF